MTGHLWLNVAIGVAVALLATWLLLVAALAVGRPKGNMLTESLRLLPDLLRLLRRVAADKTQPAGIRLRLGLVLAYLAFPIDPIPDFIPLLGYADDAIIAAWTLRSVAQRIGINELRRHWPGTEDGFQALCRLAGLGKDREPRRESR